MKNILPIVIIVITTAASAQNYTPFSGNKGWCVDRTNNLAYFPSPFYYEKDTTINSVHYNKYIFDLDNSSCYLREDTSTARVYRYKTGNSTDQLLYDFNFETGDTITLNFDVYDPVLFTVSGVDSVQAGTDWLKRINFTHNDPDLDSTFSWIEGVGSNWHPDYLKNPSYTKNFVILVHRVLCLYKNHQLFYAADTANCTTYSASDCKGLLGTSTAEKGPVQVYPVPFNSHITIETENILSLKITDITGRVITPLQTRRVGTQTLIVLAEKMSPGTYFLTINLETGVFVQKIIKE